MAIALHVHTMRITSLLLAAGLVAPAVSALAADHPMELRCKIYGPVAGEKLEQSSYRRVVEGVWSFDPASVTKRPVTSPGCLPVGRKSRVFGEEDGTRLQFAAWKCGTDKPYYTVKVLLNGLSVVQQLPGGLSRITFNDDDPNDQAFVEPGGELPADAPLSVREGKFRFLYLDCNVAKRK